MFQKIAMESFSNSPRNRRTIIGHSEEGRPISVTYHGNPIAPLRILVMAGQHGDEDLARHAAYNFSNEKRVDFIKENPNVNIAVLPELNPDGVAYGIRTNARGVDLNRDHQLLRSVETKALHQFVREWRPHLVLDLHTYPPRRKHLLAKRLVYCHDLFFDIPTNPAIQEMLPQAALEGLLKNLGERLTNKGYHAGRYLLIGKSGRVRHSTPDVMDARNGLGLRYLIPVILMECREPARNCEHQEGARLIAGIKEAMECIIHWAIENRHLLDSSSHQTCANQEVPISNRYRKSDKTPICLFKDARTENIVSVKFSKKFTPHVQTIETVKLPIAYAVPSGQKALLDLLEFHGFTARADQYTRPLRIEEYFVEHFRPSRRRSRPPRQVVIRNIHSSRILADYRIFPIDASNGRALAIYLEPNSKYGLVRFPEKLLRLEAPAIFKVLRILDTVL